jgi:hypothetical protein
MPSLRKQMKKSADHVAPNEPVEKPCFQFSQAVKSFVVRVFESGKRFHARKNCIGIAPTMRKV